MTFWKWLEENSSWIKDTQGDMDANAEKVSQEFEKHFPALSWEIEAADEGPWLFIISADCNLDLFDEVIEAYQNATQIDGWIILPFRQPGDLAMELEYGDTKYSAENVWVEVVPVEHEDSDQFDLTIFMANFDEELEEDIAEVGYQLLDNTIGEFEAATLFDAVNFADIENVPDRSESCFPLIDLVEFVDKINELEGESAEDLDNDLADDLDNDK